MKALIAGWFSFEQMGATAGDLLVRDLVREWLAAAGVESDIAVAPPFGGGVDWQTVDPGAYTHVVFVCGPFGNGWPVPEFLERFRGRRLIGLDLSMIEPVADWNPFDLLIERDSTTASRPDLAFAASASRVPVVGVVLVHAQKEYPRGMHEAAHAAIRRLLDSREVAAVEIDTRLDVNATGLRTAAEVESLIARMDAVVTTRLHGTVLALKNGVPALAIDPIPGGAKILKQAHAVGWPAAFDAADISDEHLGKAFDFCLMAEARAKAIECRERALGIVAGLRTRLVDFVTACR